VEEFFQRDAHGRIIWVGIHDISHHIPPLLCDWVHVGCVLAIGVAIAFLNGKEQIGFFVPKDAIVAHSGVLDHLFQFRPYSGVTFGILSLATWFQVHFERKSFHFVFVLIISQFDT